MLSMTSDGLYRVEYLGVVAYGASATEAWTAAFSLAEGGNIVRSYLARG